VRVGVVLEQCLARVPGGTGRYSRELALALGRQAPAGSSVRGVTAFHRDRLTVRGVPVRRLALPRRPLVAAWERGLPPRVDGDVVHAPTPLFPPSKVPLVVTVHDAVPWTHPHTLTPRGVRWHRHMVSRAAAEAALVVVPTRAVAEELSLHLALPDVLVVGEGVSADLVLPPDADARAQSLGLPERFLLTVATLEPRKGLAELIAALHHLPGLPLVCAGRSGWGGVSAQALADAAGVDVRVVGNVTDADLAVLLHRAVAVVVPSHAEGFGLPLLEAMAAGTPVLTSDAPALVEVAGGAALAVPMDALVDGLREITTNEALRRRLALEGPRRASAFSWDESARVLWRAYEDLRAGVSGA
jgi:glycosyltransferase involved in cell wall biosynthesis